MIDNVLIFESIATSIDGFDLDKKSAWEYIVRCSEFARSANEETKEQILKLCDEEFERLKRIAWAGVKVEC